MAVGCLCAYACSHCGSVEFVGVEPGIETFAQLRILYEHPRAYEPRDIECLRWCAEGDSHCRGIVAYSSECHMSASAEHQVAVNLVAYHYHARCVAHRGKSAQSLLIPLYAYRIVGVAQHKHLWMLPVDYLLKAVEVH